jgi:hypothetical protein
MAGARPLMPRVAALRQPPAALSAMLAAFGSDDHTVLLTLAVVIGVAAGAAVTVVGMGGP